MVGGWFGYVVLGRADTGPVDPFEAAVDSIVEVAMADPTNTEVVDALALALGMRVSPVVGTSVVWTLSFKATGMPWSGPRTFPSALSRSRRSASASAFLFTVITAFT